METTLENVRLLRQEQILKDWWREVNENFWVSSAHTSMKQLLKTMLECTLLEDFELQIAQMDHAPYRNGYYSRALHTQYGLLQDLKVPRLRHGQFQTRVFQRYQRFQPQVEALLQEIFLTGVSTRKVGELMEPLLQTKVSASKVSKIAQSLDRQVHAYHHRTLIDEYQYLIADGITIKVRYNNKYHKRFILVLYGITLFGRRELLAFTQAKAESTRGWESLLHNVFNRGLHGKNLKLIVMDGSAGLKAACDLVYPHVPIQRCWAHKLRNVSNYCKKKYEQNCIRGAQQIYLSTNRTEALRRFRNWKKAWAQLCPKAVACLERDLDDLLNFLECPKDHQVKIRTTNVIERAFREVRRRTRVFSCFSNLKSSERIIFAIFSYLNNRWKAKPLSGFTQFN